MQHRTLSMIVDYLYHHPPCTKFAPASNHLTQTVGKQPMPLLWQETCISICKIVVEMRRYHITHFYLDRRIRTNCDISDALVWTLRKESLLTGAQQALQELQAQVKVNRPQKTLEGQNHYALLQLGAIIKRPVILSKL